MLPPEGGSSQIGVLATSQETWPEAARSGRKPASQSRGGTPTGERAASSTRPCQLHGRLEEASVGVPLPFFFRCSVPSVLRSVIAGLDPAIHTEAKRARSFRLCFASRESPWTTGSSPVVTKRSRACWTIEDSRPEDSRARGQRDG